MRTSRVASAAQGKAGAPSPKRAVGLALETSASEWRAESFWASGERGQLLVHVMECVGILPGEGGALIKLTLGDTSVHTKAKYPSLFLHLFLPPSTVDD